MKIAKDTTPWARKSLKGGDLLLIANAEPKEAEVHFGYSNGWTARIRLNRAEIGVAHHMFTIRGALAEAMKEMLARKAA